MLITRLGGALLAASAIAVGLAVPASASIAAHITDTDGDPVNVRSGPGTGYGVVGTVYENQSVTVDCEALGTSVNGNNVWDHLVGRGYVSNLYVWTGYDGRSPNLPLCGGSTPPTTGVRQRVVNLASAEVGNGHLLKYGGSAADQWCSFFATWVWRQAGISIPNYGFSGDVFTWGQARGLAHWGTAGMGPGDMILFGTGPQNGTTSPHIGLVDHVNSDGTVVTVEGNYSNAVHRVGPFSPSWRNDVGAVYGYVTPPGA